MAITPAFQADNVGSIPTARSNSSFLRRNWKSTFYGWFLRFSLPWNQFKIILVVNEACFKELYILVFYFSSLFFCGNSALVASVLLRDYNRISKYKKRSTSFASWFVACFSVLKNMAWK